MAAAGLGAAVLMIVCCAAPVLVAVGALGALGGVLGNPWVIAAAIIVLAAAVIRRRRSGRHACCPPTEATKNPTDRNDAPADQEGPRFR